MGGFILKLTELWRMYEEEKRFQGFSLLTIKAYSIQIRMLLGELGELGELGDLEIDEITIQRLKEYLAKQSERLKPSSLGPCRFP
jgi:integrase/recombinase XerD